MIILFKLNKDIYIKTGNIIYIRIKGVTNFQITQDECITDFLDNINNVSTDFTLKEIIQILKEI